MNKDLISNIGIRTSLFPSLYVDGIYYGEAIDISNFQSCALVFVIGEVDNDTALFSVQESNDGNTNWVDIPSSRFIGSFELSVQPLTTHCIGLVDIGGYTKRFIRLVLDVTNGVSAIACAYAILGHPTVGPVFNPTWIPTDQISK